MAAPGANTGSGHQVPELDLDGLQVKSVSGSTAGAGSGDFHLYKNQRRAEYLRLKAMDDAATEADKDREWAQSKAAAVVAEAQATMKKAAKRKKRKERAKAKANQAKSAAKPITNKTGSTSASSETPETKRETETHAK